MRSALFLIFVGLGGAAILIALGTWQVQRLAWKQGVIADIDARIVAKPVALPVEPDPAQASYLPVKVTGHYSGDPLRVLVSQKEEGAGYRLISAFATEQDGYAQMVMVDRGFVRSAAAESVVTPDTEITVTGNLQWPQEVDSFTPEPDTEGNIWFARDVTAMAQALNTAPVLIVARSVSADASGVFPMPVDTTRIPNNHLQYAITWFSLAFIWLAMALYFVRRRRA